MSKIFFGAWNHFPLSTANCEKKAIININPRDIAKEAKISFRKSGRLFERL
jgi:hypothetical protein